MKKRSRFMVFVVTACLAAIAPGCSKNTVPANSTGAGSTGANSGSGATMVPTDVSFWLTKGDETALLQRQNVALRFTDITNSNPTITVDSALRYQSIDGFGFSLTDGSAALIYGLSDNVRTSLLRELFSTDSNAINISYLRISIGASDLSQTVYSYDDVPAGKTDTALLQFSLRKDQSYVVPLLKEILAINPSIQILGSPWSPPVWMKDNGSSIGGSLRPQFYGVYAQYFVKYIEAMSAEGIHIDAVTPQNEPLNPANNPSLYMTAAQESSFVGSFLGPALSAAGLHTRIQVWDHNCDHPDFPLTILNDATASPYVDGSAFHLYSGDVSALSTVHNAFPEKNIYFTEQYTASTGDFAGDLKWHVRNVIIGTMRNWSRNALEWNLANDPNFQPHTPGGCTTCKGALTIANGVTRNVSYFIVAHASKFVLPGSVRIGTDEIGSLSNVAFQRPDGKKVLIVENDGSSSQTFNVKYNGRIVTATLDGGAVGTFIW